ncbi:MAG: hypothetical protein ACAI25_16895 [Planctomycetota bacterium]
MLNVVGVLLTGHVDSIEVRNSVAMSRLQRLTQNLKGKRAGGQGA